MLSSEGIEIVEVIGMKTISTRELKDRLASGPAALFDVRGDVEYERAHIEGARSAPLGSLTFRVASLMNPDSQIIVYSVGGGCTLSAQAAERLKGLRMRNVYVYEDGLTGWQEAGHEAVESTHARVHARGPVIHCRPVIVDRDNAYGGVFRGAPSQVEGAGG